MMASRQNDSAVMSTWPFLPVSSLRFFSSPTFSRSQELKKQTRFASKAREFAPLIWMTPSPTILLSQQLMRAIMNNTFLMMKAILQNGYGPPQQVLTMGQVLKPVLTNSSKDHDDVLVRILATSVNTPDWAQTLGIPYMLRLGIAGLGKPKNVVLGSDVAGIVEESNSADFLPGDAVYGSLDKTGFSKGTNGSFCEYAIIPASRLVKKPPNVSFEQAAGAVMSGVVALQAIRDAAQAKPGQSILINGASGGIGTFAIQIAKIMGATVTGVCSGRNVELVKSLGADRVIDYEKQDFTEGEEQYDVILDNVLNHSFKESKRVLKPGGYVIPNSVGTDRGKWFGAIPSFFVKPSDYPTIECEPTRENLEAIGSMISSGDVKVIIDKVYSFEETPEAVARMASRRPRGNVIIQVSKK